MHFPKFDISKFCIYMYIINVEILKCNIIIDPKFIKKINASREDWTLDPWFTRPVLCHWAIEATLSTIDISKLLIIFLISSMSWQYEFCTVYKCTPKLVFYFEFTTCREFWIEISSLQVAHLPTHHLIQETQLYKMNASNYYYYPYTMYNPYYFHFYSAREMLMHVFFELLLLIFLPKSYFYYKFCTYIWRGVFTTCHLK